MIRIPNKLLGYLKSSIFHFHSGHFIRTSKLSTPSHDQQITKHFYPITLCLSLPPPQTYLFIYCTGLYEWKEVSATEAAIVNVKISAPGFWFSPLEVQKTVPLGYRGTAPCPAQGSVCTQVGEPRRVIALSRG